METSCRPSCTVCAHPTPTKELIADRLAWGEPFDSIETIFGVSALDLDRHSASDPWASISRGTDFPFFENAGFLLLGPASYDYLVWTRDRVRRPTRETDKRFCVLVGFVADSFLQKSNLQNFLEYSRCFADAQKIISTVDTAEIPDEVLLSDDGLNCLPNHWLLQTADKAASRPTDPDRPGLGLANFSPDWERIRIYGHGAVTLHQIAILADREVNEEGSIHLCYTDETKSRWLERVFWGWLRLKFWIEHTIPVMRKKRPIDVAYHALRVSSPFDPPGAAALRQKVKKLDGARKALDAAMADRHDSQLPVTTVTEYSEKAIREGAERKQKELEKKFSQPAPELEKAQQELLELYRPLENPGLAQFAEAEINRELEPLLQSRKYANLTKFRRPVRKHEESKTKRKRGCQPSCTVYRYDNGQLQQDEIVSMANMAVGKAAAQDRANTPLKDWYLKLWRDFERGSPAPIALRVSRDISDELRREWREKNATRGLTLTRLGPQGQTPVEPSCRTTSAMFRLAGRFATESCSTAYRAEGSETAEEWKQMRVGAATILETVTFKKQVPCEFTKAEMVIMKDQICKTPKERAIWQAKIEDPESDLDQLQERVRSETGEDFTLQYIQQIASKLRRRANGIKSRRR